MLFDLGQYELIDQNIFPEDPLAFKDTKPYAIRLRENIKKTGLSDAVLNAVGTMDRIRIIMSAMEFAFMGGSMGSVVGEKITRAFERALAEKIPTR